MVDSRKRPGEDLGRIDRNILSELQKDGRISNVELSKRMGLSLTPCPERIRWLEGQGSIQGYTVLLNPHYLDALPLVLAKITLNCGVPDVFEQFNTAVQKLEEVQECHLISDGFDYLLKIRMLGMSVYRRLLGETLLRLPGVNDTRTYIVTGEIKQSNHLIIKTCQHGAGAKPAYFDYVLVSLYGNSTGVAWYYCSFQHRAGKACNLENLSRTRNTLKTKRSH